MDLIITGRVIDAREAERIGLVNEVVPRGQSLHRALELARFICTPPQPAIRTDKESVLQHRPHLRRSAARRSRLVRQADRRTRAPRRPRDVPLAQPPRPAPRRGGVTPDCPEIRARQDRRSVGEAPLRHAAQQANRRE